MKKIISIVLALCLCFCFAFASSAAEISTQEQQGYYDEIILIEKETSDENTDIFDSLESFFPAEENEELDKFISLAEKAATLIYNFATQPEEPPVDLATVITIVRIAVTVIYTLVQNYA